MANLISQKCYYGIKAVYDLADHRAEAPVKISAIAARQSIPIRFLEAILRQLRQAGFVDSRRGSEGGYLLAKHPSQIKILDIIQYFEGDFAQFPGLGESPPTEEDDAGHVLADVWGQGQEALLKVLDHWTIADLLDKAEEQRATYVANFTI